MGPLSIAFAAVGGLALLVWLTAVSWVWRRRPPREVRDALVRALPAVCETLEVLATHEDLDAALRTRMRRASRYVGWPIDIVPDGVGAIGHVDDVVFALEALRVVHEAHGIDLIEDAWAGDDLGWNALRMGLGLGSSWSDGASVRAAP